MDWSKIHTMEEMDILLDEKIQKTRKHMFQIQILNALGNVCPQVKIRAFHKNHDFLFGTCPNGHLGMTNRLACQEGKAAEKYWKRIGDLYNATTLWWGWRALEPERGIKTFDRVCNDVGPMDRMLERAEALGHRVTAHALLYPRNDVAPEWLKECTKKEALQCLEDHVKQTVERYKNRISCWHPVNEAYADIQQAWNLIVNEGLVYRWVGDIATHADIVDNGGYIIDPDFYEKGIRNAELYGARVDDLGVRGYFELYDSEALPFYQSIWEHFDHLAARYGKGIRFTEIGATSSYKRRKDALSIEENIDPTVAAQIGIISGEQFAEKKEITEETQKIFLTRMYRLIFAHPALKECSYWDTCDDYTWNGVEGGLIRSDLSPKPAYEALQELIHSVWSTDVVLESDEDGICEFTGFDGMYEVEVSGKKYPIHLNQENNCQCVVIY